MHVVNDIFASAKGAVFVFQFVSRFVCLSIKLLKQSRTVETMNKILMVI